MNALDHAFLITRNTARLSEFLTVRQAAYLLGVKAGLDKPADLARALEDKDTRQAEKGLCHLTAHGLLRRHHAGGYYTLTTEGCAAIKDLLDTRNR